MKITHEVQISDTKDAFTNSREALALLLTKFGHQIGDLREDLALNNFQNLPKFPEYLTSLTHTKGAGAALLAEKSEYRSLGIDIEWSDRVMKKEADRFFRHPMDSVYPESLELWTMKEAAFKALSPLGHHGVLVLSKIIIQDGIFWTQENPEINGFVRVHKLPVADRALYLSIAYITLNKSKESA